MYIYMYIYIYVSICVFSLTSGRRPSVGAPRLFFADETRPAQNFRGHRSVEGFFRYAQRMTSPAVQRMSREELETAMAKPPWIWTLRCLVKDAPSNLMHLNG